MVVPSEMKRSQSQDSGLNKIRNLFEIKRPSKSTNSTTLPCNGSNANEVANFSGDKMFVRHHSNRVSSRKKKYQKVTPEMDSKEIETKNTLKVKDMCHLFEKINIATEENAGVETKIREVVPSTLSTVDECDERKQLLEDIAGREAKIEELKTIGETDELMQRMIQKRIDKIMSELTKLYEQTKVKRRNRYDTDEKESRQRKIKSFVEAENDEEAEEYRKSLIKEMDQEIAKMKADGFMDDYENDTTNETQDICYQRDDIINSQRYPSGDVLFDVRNVNKHISDITPRNSDDSEYVFRKDVSSEIMRDNSNCIRYDEYKKSDDSKGPTANPTHILDDELSESIGDEINDGELSVFEAYNDEGRELIENRIIIDRRTITLGKEENIELFIGESEMVFYKQDNNTFQLVHDGVEDNFDIEKDYREETCSNQKDSEEISYDNSRTSQKYPLETDLKSPNYDIPGQCVFVYPSASDRSTFYSSTSSSSVFDEDDEGIEMGRNNYEEVQANVRRETICDDKGVVRIDRVALPGRGPYSNKSTEGHSDASPLIRSKSTTPARQLEFIIEEIKITERKYVEDLGKIIKDYKPYIENNTPPNLIRMSGYLFGNIEKIYKKQLKFLEALEKCSDFVYGVVRCFIEHKHVFELYQYYFKNKPKADILIKEFHVTIKEMQEKFEERLDFSAYLLTPVQRLGKYILFLENIEKQLTKLNQPVEIVQEARNIVRSEMTKGNDAVAIESIENSPISKLDYGSFKMREKFSISKPRKVDAMVFLFENVLVFTTNDQRNLEIYNYYDSIKMNDLRIATFEDYTIHLTDYTKSKKKNNPTRYTYVLEAKNEKLWSTWKKCIEEVLWEQLNEVKESLKATTLPRKYKKYRVDRSRIKSTGSSVFYVE